VLAPAASWSVSGFSGRGAAREGRSDAPSEAAVDAASDGVPGVVGGSDAAERASVAIQTPKRDDNETVDLTATGTLDSTQKRVDRRRSQHACAPWIGTLSSRRRDAALRLRPVNLRLDERHAARVGDGRCIEGSGSAFTIRVKYQGSPRASSCLLRHLLGWRRAPRADRRRPTAQRNSDVLAEPSDARRRMAIDAPHRPTARSSSPETTALAVLDSDTPGQVANIAIIASALSARP